jgi:hypothetical protein
VIKEQKGMFTWKVQTKGQPNVYKEAKKLKAAKEAQNDNKTIVSSQSDKNNFAEGCLYKSKPETKAVP